MQSDQHWYDRFNGLTIRVGDLVIASVIFVGFGSLYAFLSLMLSQTGVFSVNDVLFEIDAKRSVGDITQFSAMHYRTTVHPLFELLVNPPGEAIQRIVHSSLTAAAVLNSLAGALGTMLAYVFFSLAGPNRRVNLLFTLLFGVTASQIFHSAIPDTSAFAVVSLMLTSIAFLITLRRMTISLPVWIVCGIFSLGITTTNFIQTVICFCVACLAVYGSRQWKVILNKTVFFFLLVVSVTACLSLLQKFIYPLSNPFFMPYAYTDETKYASLLILQQPLEILRLLGQDFLLVNFIAPYPLTYMAPERTLLTVSLENSTRFSPAGLAAGVLWLALCIVAAAGIFQRKAESLKDAAYNGRYLAAGFLLCLLCNFILHCVYGAAGPGDVNYFLYSGNFTFPVAGLVYLAYRRMSTLTRGALLVLILCMLVNNVQVFYDVIRVYSGV